MQDNLCYACCARYARLLVLCTLCKTACAVSSLHAVLASSAGPDACLDPCLWGGLQGSARDLGAVRSHMQLAQPDLDYLMSKCNQDRTADGLQIMGHRLATEVAQYLQVSITLICLVIFM